jgi:MFS family permease
VTAAPLRTRLAWLGGLSFASGLPYFLFNETIPLWLAQEGMSLAGIGLATGASMPWVLKFLWAPVVDRLGSRRTWIRACLLLLAAATAILTASVLEDLLLPTEGAYTAAFAFSSAAGVMAFAASRLVPSGRRLARAVLRDSQAAS